MNTANWVTLLRFVPFAGSVIFIFLDRIHLAATLFFIAWALDAVDGYTARRLHQETKAGYLFDKAVDRLIVVGTLSALIFQAHVPLLALLLLTKDLLTAPAAFWQLRHTGTVASLGISGKLFTAAQGAALLWLMLGGPEATKVVGAIAAWGVGAGAWYLWRNHRPIKLSTG